MEGLAFFDLIPLALFPISLPFMISFLQLLSTGSPDEEDSPVSTVSDVTVILADTLFPF